MSNNNNYICSIEKSRNNCDILLINDKFIHSKFNPLNEAADFICPEKSLILIFGLGFAYHVNNIIKNNPASSFIIYKPLEEIFKTGKKYFALNFLSDKKILILNKIDENTIYDFIAANNSLSLTRIKTYSNIGYKALFQNEENAFFNAVKNNVETLVRNTLTESAFIPLWTKNILSNINKLDKNFLTNPKTADLKENLCVIVCAGPNLSSDIGLLKMYRDKITIFAVDTALKTLRAHKIYPDFAVSLDGQYYSYDDFIFKSFDETTFIFDTSSFPKISRHFKNVYFTQTENIFDRSISEYFFSAFGLKKFGLFTGGNVSDYAMSLAISFGFKNIYFSGLDLSFPNLLTHSHSSPFYERVLYTSGYFNTFESQTFSIISKRNLKTSSSRTGKEILSDFVLSNYAYYFANYAKLYSNIKFYYQDIHALKIDNFEKINLEELLKTIKSRKVNAEDIMKASENFIFERDKLNSFFIKLNEDIYQFALKLSALLDKTDFSCSENKNEWIRLINDLLTNFPFFKKFAIMTEIILDKKNIFEDNILYYKHIGHKILQSIYYIIRTVKKISASI